MKQYMVIVLTFHDMTGGSLTYQLVIQTLDQLGVDEITLLNHHLVRVRVPCPHHLILALLST